MLTQAEIRVCMDVGCHQHRVLIGLANGEILEEFDPPHTPLAIKQFFHKTETYQNKYSAQVVFAMEGYNGHARPIDKFALIRGYRLLNVNNNKLAKFKEIFPGPAKSDEIDTRKIFELLTLHEHLPMAKKVLNEVVQIPEVNEKLKRLTRRRQALVREKVRAANRLQSDLNAVAPSLSTITKDICNVWFLNFITARDNLCKLSKLKLSSILKIKGVGKKYADLIMKWQKEAVFSADLEWVNSMILSDAYRIIGLKNEIGILENEIEALFGQSDIAKRIRTINGFGPICSAELAGEIGSLNRFANESSLSLYLGMTSLTNQSGQYSGTKKTSHVNSSAKKAMMIAVARHIDNVEESKAYYDKKRLEGKKHNQAVRALGRHLVRVIWSMLKKQRDYEMRR
jgi:transposase